MENSEIKDQAAKLKKRKIEYYAELNEPRYKFNRLRGERPYTVYTDIIELQTWVSFLKLIQLFFIGLPIYFYTVINDEILGGCFVFLAIPVYIVGRYFIKFSKTLEEYLYRYGFMIYEQRKNEKKL